MGGQLKVDCTLNPVHGVLAFCRRYLLLTLGLVGENFVAAGCGYLGLPPPAVSSRPLAHPARYRRPSDKPLTSDELIWQSELDR